MDLKSIVSTDLTSSEESQAVEFILEMNDVLNETKLNYWDLEDKTSVQVL